MDIKKDIVNQFGDNAESYVNSNIHAKGNDLKMMVDVSEVTPNAELLDIATGGGHTANAFASLVSKVVAFDLTPKMLEVAKQFILGNGHTNVEFVQGDAENLPFKDKSFDVVTCRIAAHHFPNIEQFIKESYRVLKNNGYFLLIDNVGPEVEAFDSFYNEIEKKRDHSHYRAWKKSEWINFLEKQKFTIEAMFRYEKQFNFIDWCERMKVSQEDMVKLENFMVNASPEILNHFKFAFGVNHQVISFSGESILLKAKK